MPYFRDYDRNCDQRVARIGGGGCEGRQSIKDLGPAPADIKLAEISTQYPNVTYLDLRSILCRKGSCSPYLDGHPVYYNSTHLSMTGSWSIGEKLLESPDANRWSEALSGQSHPAMMTQAQHAKIGRDNGALLQIIGGYVPDFPYLIRSQNRADALDGHGAIVLEFWGRSISEVVASVKRAMGSKGLILSSEGPSGPATRLDFVGPSQLRISINIGPIGALTPRAARVDGIVYIHW